MGPEEKKKKGKNPPAEEDTSEHVLLNPEEWKDPEEVTVIKEYHKTPIPGSEEADELDLDAFEKNWDAKGKGQTASEYHKKDAPFMDGESEQEGPQSRERIRSKKAPGEELRPRKEFTLATGPKAGEKEAYAEKIKEKVTETTGSVREELTKATDTLTGRSLGKAPKTRSVIDISTLEVLGYTVFRAMFGQGVRVPLKIEGSMDMDIAVKDTNVIINTNDVTFEPPVLQIWHFIFAYKGRPVIEYGRGVTRVKVHYYNAFVMLLAMWWGGKKKRKAKEKASRARDKELLARSVEGNEKHEEKGRMGGDQ